MIYANEIDILKNTTATGRDGTSKMSDEKKDAVQTLFKKRLMNSKNEQIRLKKLNRHVKNAFSNSRREPKKAKGGEKQEDKEKE